MAYPRAFTAEGRPIPAPFGPQEINRLDPRRTARRDRAGGKIAQTLSLHRIEGTPDPDLHSDPRPARAAGRACQRGRAERPVHAHRAAGTDPGLARTLSVTGVVLGVSHGSAGSLPEP